MCFKKYWVHCEYLTYCPVLIFIHCYPGVWENALGYLPYHLVKQIGPNVIFCLRGSHSIPHAVSAHSQLALKESSHSQSSVSSDLDQLFTTSWSPYWSCPSLTRLTLRVHCAGTLKIWGITDCIDDWQRHEIIECSSHNSCTLFQVFWTHIVYMKNEANIFHWLSFSQVDFY